MIRVNARDAMAVSSSVSPRSSVPPCRARPSLLAGVLFFSLAFLAGSPHALAQCEIDRLVLDEPASEAPFFVSIDTDAARAVVGIEEDDRVLFFRRDRSTWVPDGSLQGVSGSGFGANVAIDGDRLIVGAPMQGGSGAVLVYRLLNGVWRQERTLIGDASRLWFGRLLETSGDRLVVYDTNTLGRAKFHTFVEAEPGVWTQGPSTGQLLFRRLDEYTLSVSGDRVAVGPISDGTVLAYDYEGGNLVERFRSEGGSIALDGDTLAVGRADLIGRGEVQMYERVGQNWIESDLLQPDGRIRGDGFASAVALSGDRLVAGGRPGASTRLLYYRRDPGGTWQESATLREANEDLFRQRTHAIVIDGSDALFANLQGDVFAYHVGNRDCGELCRGGSVNAGQGIVDVLFVNGITGDAQREISAQAEDPLLAYVLRPPGGGSGRFVMHANLSAPDDSTVALYPPKNGLVCFDFRIPSGAMPGAIWNNLGARGILGSSRYFDGAMIPDPAPAPSIFLQLDQGDPANLPPGTTVTFQGGLVDPNGVATRSVSVTNAIVLRIE